MSCKVTGRFHIRCLNPDGSVAWEEYVKNAATTVGLNALLSAVFKSGAQVATWYIGLINNASFDEVVVGDTMSSHAGWTEFTSYSESTRVAWAPGTPASAALASSSYSTFTISAAGEVYGVFLNSVSTKGGTSGTLWATAGYALPRAVTVGQALQIGYTVEMSST